MTTRTVIMASLALMAATLLYAWLVYPALPDHIPVHWNYRGEIDGWGPKSWAAFLMPGAIAFMTLMAVVLPAISPSPFRVVTFLPTFNFGMLLSNLLFGFMHIVMLQTGLHPEWRSDRIMMTGIFLFFAVLGNVMGRVKRNPWTGFRTPWSLANDTNWKATHRFGGRVMVAAGILGAAASLAGVSFVFCLGLLVGSCLLPVFYSYWLFRQIG